MVTNQSPINSNNEEEIVREILRSIRTIKYGSVQLIIQDGKIIQVDKTEKLRFSRDNRG
ncbi:MAG: YezD family protein [Dehalococcoidia bacterium]|nr:YezD family protein [Dehalococcoidia bacterium]